MKHLVPVLLVAAGLTACGGADSKDSVSGAASDSPTTADSAGPSHLGSAEELPDSLPRFVPDERWVVEAPSSGMRLHQYRLPGPEVGEGESAGDGAVVVAAWPTDVGGLDANLKRWIQQSGMSLAVDQLSDEQLAMRQVRHFDVHVLALEGAQGSAGEADAHGAAGTPMLVAYIEKPAYPGVWTVKLTGPLETIRDHEEAFQAFLDRL